jgi:hypothetical protein
MDDEIKDILNKLKLAHSDTFAEILYTAKSYKETWEKTCQTPDYDPWTDKLIIRMNHKTFIIPLQSVDILNSLAWFMDEVAAFSKSQL